MSKRPVILYRDVDIDPKELFYMKRNFPTFESRLDIRARDLVIGRYSMLPFYDEQERDFIKAGAQCINTWRQHRYIADMDWIVDLEGLTPKTWLGGLSDVPSGHVGPLVLKGATNSKKHRWNTHMFAPDRAMATNVLANLLDDALVGQQKIVVREYVPLVTYKTGLYGLPITKEFRCFMLRQHVLATGYYWASHAEDPEAGKPDPNEIPTELLQDVARRVGAQCNFYVVDVAQTQAGKWIVVELNDGQMSGLSMCDPAVLYPKLADALETFADV